MPPENIYKTNWDAPYREIREKCSDTDRYFGIFKAVVELNYRICPDNKHNSAGFQSCPTCFGLGSAPFSNQNSSSVGIPCTVCRGHKIINIETGLSPAY